MRYNYFGKLQLFKVPLLRFQVILFIEDANVKRFSCDSRRFYVKPTLTVCKIDVRVCHH